MRSDGTAPLFHIRVAELGAGGAGPVHTKTTTLSYALPLLDRKQSLAGERNDASGSWK